MKKTKILLIGERYSANLGDCVICEVTEWLLRERFGCETVTLDISGRTGYNIGSNPPAAKKWLKSLLLRMLSALFRVFGKSEFGVYKRFSRGALDYIEDFLGGNCDYDAAVFAGGQMFCAHFVLQIAKIVELLSEKGVPVYFNACGAGKIYSAELSNILKSALTDKAVKSVTTRDDKETIDGYLKEKGTECRVTFDPAVFTPDFYGITKKSPDVIGLGIMFVRHVRTAELVRFWLDIIALLDAKGEKWRLFCNGSEADFDLARKILRKTGRNPDGLIAERPVYPGELAETISGFKGIISFRLHSHIIAYSLGIPSVALAWDDKLYFFFRNIGCESRCMAVGSKAADVICGLENALSQGFDPALRERHKEAAVSALLDAAETSRAL